eukprot:scaffold81555_cov98-Phaeocystis_antarctica.AAC.1
MHGTARFPVAAYVCQMLCFTIYGLHVLLQGYESDGEYDDLPERVAASRRCGIKTTTIGLYDVWTQMATTSATSAFFGVLRPSTRVSRVHTP